MVPLGRELYLVRSAVARMWTALRPYSPECVKGGFLEARIAWLPSGRR
jgi:hypothetical protein